MELLTRLVQTIECNVIDDLSPPPQSWTLFSFFFMHTVDYIVSSALTQQRYGVQQTLVRRAEAEVALRRRQHE